MFGGQRPHPSSAHLSVTTYAQVCACLTVCDALRVPVPPSAKLNLRPPPFLCQQRQASFLAAPILNANTACVSTSQPVSQGNVRKPLLPKAQRNCPVIVHSSTAQRVEEGGGVERAVSTLHPRYRNLTVSIVLNSTVTPVDRQREEVMVQHILETESCFHFVITFKLHVIKENQESDLQNDVNLVMYFKIVERNLLWTFMHKFVHKSSKRLVLFFLHSPAGISY